MSTLKLSAKRKRKEKQLYELKNLLLDYPTVIVARLHRVDANYLHNLRNKFRGAILFKVAKNTLFRKALEEVYDKNIDVENFKSILTGENVLIFTKENPFKICLGLYGSRVAVTPSPGDVAPEDVVVPEGDTGIPPGPAISDFSQLGIETRIVKGTINVVRSKVIARKGEKISSEVASILSKLGIKPITIWLDPKGALTDGIFIPEDLLKINVDEYREKLKDAVVSALNFAVNIQYPAVEVLPTLILKAYNAALSLVSSIALPIPEMIVSSIVKAVLAANVLYSTVEGRMKGGETLKEGEEPSEEEEGGLEGLAALFG
ncbi:MAG: 50S ribosomal protein L10 [Candidatus Bathyarchaeota archaeon]|nr:50S ribosomal protein L10 [Candidatus Bathyarchaeota archaeon]MCX8161782.1 50S ribosomal protein L10 [Candidatus Bathyarchaeota archaeon]